jgi:hypothetical protein
MDIGASTDGTKPRPVAGATVPPEPVTMPAGPRRLVLALVGAVLASALYLIAVRGEALILDLAKLGSVFCF